MAGIAARPIEDRPMLGIVLMLFTYFLFSCVDVSAKWLALAGLPAAQLAFMRYFCHVVISVGLIAREGVSLSRFGTDRVGLVLLRSVLLVSCTVLNFIAVRYLPLTLTSTIMFSSPIIICALSGPFLGEKVGVWRWSAIVAGFGGILIAIRPFDAGFHWAVFLSLGNALAFAIYALITRKLSGKVSSDTMQLYSGLVGAALLAPFAMAAWQSPATPLDWTLMVGLGVLGWVGHEMLTRAHGYAAASALTPFSYVFIIYLGTWSYVVFGDLPDRWTVLGALIITAAGMTIWLRERWLAKSEPGRLVRHPAAETGRPA
ncbi:DMT family transporter [Chelativorans xinjiangense]|uniref:DMT family transporter n=1 Tax=Chelativorans xinjiangense TaxID=2681485 RepID=UPI001358435C|nr:DMT family transporter [Chelativorans xinjiangense]